MKMLSGKGRCALVTGARRGIGLGIAKALLAEGYRVMLCGMTAGADAVSGIRDALDALGDWTYVPCDVSDAAQREELLEAAKERFGRLDLLVNNAGVAPKERSDLLQMTEESFDYVVGTNTKGNMFMTQAVARRMIQARTPGIIVNISSCSAEVSSVNRGEYCVSKAGISMLTRLFADRLAGEGIRVYEVRPGVIQTDMTAAVQEKYNRLIEAGAFPIARWGQPEDVARAVRAFCSDDFAYTTGNYIDVDGGFHIRRL